MSNTFQYLACTYPDLERPEAPEVLEDLQVPVHQPDRHLLVRLVHLGVLQDRLVLATPAYLVVHEVLRVP